VKKIFSVLIIFYFSTNWVTAQTGHSKIKGISLESPPFELNLNDYKSLEETNANWVAVIPYGFSPADNPKVHFDSERQWWGERLKGTAQMIELAKSEGYKVMLKPQVWIFRGWVGDYGFETEEEWLEWEESYSEFILTFARLADTLEVELFCLGTEYKNATTVRPDFWIDLVKSVRDNYKGKLTYAANWDEYEHIKFWTELDYIGIDAYFPLSEKVTPNISELLLSWVPEKLHMKTLSDSLKKPVLLTEFGYRSVNGTAGEQWKLSGNPINLEAQRRAYLALFESLWGENWVVGGFVWKWQFRKGAGGVSDSGYTPQGKPALQILREVYK